METWQNVSTAEATNSPKSVIIDGWWWLCALVSLWCDDVRLVQWSCSFTVILWWKLFPLIRNKLPTIAGKASVHKQGKSVYRRCKMGTSCKRAVSSAVSYLHVLPSVRLTCCWCSPNHSSCWWQRAPTNTIIIILNRPQWQHGAMNLSLGSRSNVRRSKVMRSQVSVGDPAQEEEATPSAALTNID